MADFKSIYDEEMRRRKIQEAILQRSLSPQGSYAPQGPYGRVVPYSIGEGLTQLGQALIARNMGEKSRERLEQARQDEAQKYRDATTQAVETYFGKPEVTAPLMGRDAVGQQVLQEAVDPNPQKALIEAAGNPYAQGIAKVLAGIEKGNRGAYFSPRETVLPDGTIIYSTFDHRTGTWKETGRKRSPKDPASLTQQAAGKAGGKLYGESKAQAQIDLPQAEITTKETTTLVDELINHPGMKDVIGFPDNPLVLKGLVPGTDAADFRNRLNQLTGRTFIEVFPTLKGGGQITEIEGEKAQASINRMSSATTEKEFINAATDFKKEVNRLKALVRHRAGLPAEKENGYVETRTTVDGKVLGKKADGTIEVIGSQ